MVGMGFLRCHCASETRRSVRHLRQIFVKIGPLERAVVSVYRGHKGLLRLLIPTARSALDDLA